MLELQQQAEANEAKALAKLESQQAQASSQEERNKLLEQHERDMQNQRAEFGRIKAEQDAKLQRRLNAKLEKKKRDHLLRLEKERKERAKQQQEEALRIQREIEEAQKLKEMEAAHIKE